MYRTVGHLAVVHCNDSRPLLDSRSFTLMIRIKSKNFVNHSTFNSMAVLIVFILNVVQYNNYLNRINPT